MPKSVLLMLNPRKPFTHREAMGRTPSEPISPHALSRLHTEGNEGAMILNWHFHVAIQCASFLGCGCSIKTPNHTLNLQPVNKQPWWQR